MKLIGHGVFWTMAFYAEQRSNKQEGPEDQDLERSESNDTPGLLHTVINLLQQGRPRAFFHSIHTLH